MAKLLEADEEALERLCTGCRALGLRIYDHVEMLFETYDHVEMLFETLNPNLMHMARNPERPEP